jgi:hypothetical protein
MKSSHRSVGVNSQEEQTILRGWSLALTGGLLCVDLSVQALIGILKLLWSSNAGVEELQVTFSGKSPLFLFVGTCHDVLANQCLFSASNGYTRLTVSDMQVGDVACVILGCGHPVVVRPVHRVGSHSLWRVVGSAIVPGFTSGEVIYGGRLPAKYQLIDPVIDGKQYRYIRANIIREGHESAL